MKARVGEQELCRKLAGLEAQAEIPRSLLTPSVPGLGNISGWSMKPFELWQNPWNCRLAVQAEGTELI